MYLHNINIEFQKLESRKYLGLLVMTLLFISCNKVSTEESKKAEISTSKLKDNLLQKEIDEDLIYLIEKYVIPNYKLINIYDKEVIDNKHKYNNALIYFTKKQNNLLSNVNFEREAEFESKDGTFLYIREFEIESDSILRKLHYEASRDFDGIAPPIKAPSFAFVKDSKLFITYTKAESNRRDVNFFRKIISDSIIN